MDRVVDVKLLRRRIVNSWMPAKRTEDLPKQASQQEVSVGCFMCHCQSIPSTMQMGVIMVVVDGGGVVVVLQSDVELAKPSGMFANITT